MTPEIRNPATRNEVVAMVKRVKKIWNGIDGSTREELTQALLTVGVERRGQSGWAYQLNGRTHLIN